VVSVDIWRERVMVKDEAGNRRTLTLEQLKAEVAAAPPEGRDVREPDPPRGARRGPDRNGRTGNGKDEH
jgi:hypothetical protein